MGGVIKHFAILSVIMLALAACGANKEVENTSESKLMPETLETTGDATKADYVVISKESMRLRLYDTDNRLICSFGVAMGSVEGDKQEVGDMRTPEGEFVIEKIEDASQWLYDSGNGVTKGYYGNWFIRLGSEFKGIGIYGTTDSTIIGKRCTEGSVRLTSDNLDSLRPMLREGMKVRIGATDVRVAEARAVISGGESANEGQEVAVVAPVEPEPSCLTLQGNEVWHTVADGELLGRIAKSYGTTISELKRLNPNIDVDHISIGQRILISNGSAPRKAESMKESVEPKADGDAEVWHTLVKGELVGRIAQRYGTTSKRIAELNPGINIDRVREGQRIRVK